MRSFCIIDTVSTLKHLPSHRLAEAPQPLLGGEVAGAVQTLNKNSYHSKTVDTNIYSQQLLRVIGSGSLLILVVAAD